MRIRSLNVSVLAAVTAAVFLPLQSSLADANADRIAALEKRLLALEKRLMDSEQNTKAVEERLSQTEQDTKEVKVLASSAAATGGESSSILGNAATFDILAGSAWRNLRWTQEEQWEGVKVGITEEKVVELLGYPPRSVDSLKPRIDKVYWYETSIRDSMGSMRGKISFKKGKVVSFSKPDFSQKRNLMGGHTESSSRLRVP